MFVLSKWRDFFGELPNSSLLRILVNINSYSTLYIYFFEQNRFQIKKLQINAVVVDDLVSIDDVEEKILAFEDYIQSMDIAAFNKI